MIWGARTSRNAPGQITAFSFVLSAFWSNNFQFQFLREPGILLPMMGRPQLRVTSPPKDGLGLCTAAKSAQRKSFPRNQSRLRHFLIGLFASTTQNVPNRTLSLHG